jgi:RNA polymerase sigma factor (sigma-70 family)
LLSPDTPLAPCGFPGGNRRAPTSVEGAVVGRPLDEQRLVDRARRGDAAAYEELVRVHQQVAFRTACLVAGSAADAEEAAQEGFVKAWRALPRFRAGAPFRPWLLAIVANEARTRRRGERRRAAWVARAVAEVSREGPDTSAETAVLVREHRAVLLEMLAVLPERDRIVLYLRYLLDLSERETAAVLGCRPGTVNSRLSRALDRLREDVREQP